jgi:prepilin-type processing-associated H-X9-DG protein
MRLVGPVRVEVRQIAHAGKTIYYPALPLSGVPPALCVAGDRLLIGTSVNAVRRGLEQLGQPADILSDKEFQETLSRLTGQPFDARKLPPGFCYAKDYSSGTGALLCAGGGVFILSAFLGGMLESTGQEAPAQELGQPEEGPLEAFYSRPAGKVVLDVLGRLDLGLWPDEGFFRKYRRAHGSASQWTPDGLHVRVELPPPLPGLRSTGSSPLVMIGATSVGAGLLLPVLARAREQARRASSANNLSNMVKCCHLYADAADKWKFPGDAAELYPDYVRDFRVFKNPRFGDADVGYIYVPGSTPEAVGNVVFYESIPEGVVSEGLNVAFSDGHVEWVDMDEFEAHLEKTQKALKDAGVEMKPVSISVRAASAAR